jgi:hypothetical protein
LEQGYGWLIYQAAVCVCAFGVGKSREVNDPKSVGEIQRQLERFESTPWTREQVSQALEDLVKRGTLVKTCDMYRRSDRTCCRFITIDRKVYLIAIVEFFESSTGIDYVFMLPPSQCERYNSVVSEALRLELNDKFSRGLLRVKQIADVSACGRIELSTGAPAGVSGFFGQGGTN